jgi:hypothetical protein
MDMANDYSCELKRVLEVQERIGGIHPFLETLYPIAVVKDNEFFVYDVLSEGGSYRFVKEAACPMPVPQGVRAAFPLDFYENRIACVVTPEVFDSLDGYVTIFHEFMHCQQYENCEPDLKKRLGIAQNALTANDFMWEINHPFPYSKPEFVSGYSALLEAISAEDFDLLMTVHGCLKSILNGDDYEYLVWQEWKEGFARFIENLVRVRLGLAENHGGSEPPFSRVSFYEGGAGVIRFFTEKEPRLRLDLEALFHHLYL